MSATMGRHGGRVQLKQSDMCLALKIAKMTKEGCSRATIEETKYLIKKTSPRSEKRRSGALSLLGTKWSGLQYKDTRQCFVKSKHPAAFLANIAPLRIHRDAGDAKEQVHLHPTDAESRLPIRLHHCPACHPPQQVPPPDFNVRKSSICPQDIGI